MSDAILDVSDYHGGVLLTPEQARVWRKNRDMIRAACDSNRCRCGRKNEIRNIRDRQGWVIRAESFCPKRKVTNFWKHDAPKIVLLY